MNLAKVVIGYLKERPEEAQRTADCRGVFANIRMNVRKSGPIAAAITSSLMRIWRSSSSKSGAAPAHANEASRTQND